jgi:hypothetical protein
MKETWPFRGIEQIDNSYLIIDAVDDGRGGFAAPAAADPGAEERLYA